jgi:hypothetical protein
MPLLFLAGFATSLLSLLILGSGGYFLWTWYDGEWVRDSTGVLYHVREDWRLWSGLALLAWSVFGRWVVPLVLAQRDVRPTKAERGAGRVIVSPTGSTLYVETYGREDAPSIVFTHGWGMDSTFWNYAKRDLSDRFRLIFWDLPGLGKSKAGGLAAIDLNAFATDLATIVQTCATRPVLVGHSIGGITIQTLVRDQPELQARLAGVVLLNTTYTNPLKTMILSRLAVAL